MLKVEKPQETTLLDLSTRPIDKESEPVRKIQRQSKYQEIHSDDREAATILTSLIKTNNYQPAIQVTQRTAINTTVRSLTSGVIESIAENEFITISTLLQLRIMKVLGDQGLLNQGIHLKIKNLNKLPVLQKLQDYVPFKNIISLDLDSNKIDQDNIPNLSKLLTNLTELQGLSLNNIKIGPLGAKDLLPSLKKLTQLRELYLNNNQIGNLGALSLSKAFDKLPKLTTLALRGNQIKNEGATALSGTLGKLNKLEGLYLADNEIGNIGLNQISKIFPSLPHLQFLSLRNNKITDEGANLLPISLRQITSIHMIDLSHNPINLNTLNIIHSFLRENRATLRS